jgi:hypothetical protein
MIYTQYWTATYPPFQKQALSSTKMVFKAEALSTSTIISQIS